MRTPTTHNDDNNKLKLEINNKRHSKQDIFYNKAIHNIMKYLDNSIVIILDKIRNIVMKYF